MKVALVAIVILSLGMIGMAVKILFKKGGKFEGTCASNSPFLNKTGEPCGLCGALPEEQCQNDEELVQ